ncbi:MAG: haloacid dehalogenase [Candidatus Hydrogenedentota bacterium]
MPYGLVFDMDGVLADTEDLIARASIAMFKELYNIDMIFEDFRPFIGTGAVRYVLGPAENKGIRVDLEKALEVRLRNFVALLDAGECKPFPGAHALIDAAYNHPEWKLAIATSSPGPKAIETLNSVNIDVTKFDAFIHGDLITHKKPHPEIYETAARTLGIPPSRCIAIEDAVTGTASAKAAGMTCIAVTNSFSPEELAEADTITHSLTELSLERLEGFFQ